MAKFNYLFQANHNFLYNQVAHKLNSFVIVCHQPCYFSCVLLWFEISIMVEQFFPSFIVNQNRV